MKLSVSLPDQDVEFLDAYAREQGLESRSAAVRRAVRQLRVAELGGDYEGAWAEWTVEPGSNAWESTAADGLTAR